MPIIWDDEKSSTSNIVWDDEKKSKNNPLEERISKRPDIYGEAVKGIQERFSPQGMKGFTFPQEANILLKSLGGVAQRGEAVIANPFLRKQGKFQNPITAIKEGITGEQLGELGDVARQAGLIEPIAAGLGLLGTGLLSKLLMLGKTTESFSKVETTYGRDIGKNVIKWSTGMPEQAIEHGMKRGWKNVFTKKNLDPNIPTRISSNVLNNLDDITAKEYANYGKVIDKVNQGSIKSVDLLDNVQQEFIKSGYLNIDGTDTLKIRPAVVNEVKSIFDTWKTNIKTEESIPVQVIQSLRGMIKKKIPPANLIGKKRSLNEEQRFAKNLYNKLNEIIGFNAGVENKELTLAKRSYRDFKNMEANILNTFSEVTGQEVTPTADKIVGVFKLNPTKSIEETNKIKAIDKYLVGKGFKSIDNDLFDWLTTQAALVEPQPGGASLYPFRLIAESTKYATRQALKSGVPSFIGRNIEKTGKGISAIRNFGRKSNIPFAFAVRTARREDALK